MFGFVFGFISATLIFIGNGVLVEPLGGSVLRFLKWIRSRLWSGAAVLCVLAIAGVAAAGDCRYVAPVKAVHAAAVKKVIVAPTHEEVAIIAIEKYPHYDVHVVAEDLREKQRHAEHASDVAALKEATDRTAKALERIERSLAGKQTADDEAPTGARPLPLRSAENKSDDDDDASLDEKAVAYLRTNCAQCHSGDAARGKVKYFAADKQKPVKLTPRLKFLAWSVVDDGTMPPAGEASAADKKMLKSWLESDRAALRELVKASDR